RSFPPWAYPTVFSWRLSVSWPKWSSLDALGKVRKISMKWGMAAIPKDIKALRREGPGATGLPNKYNNFPGTKAAAVREILPKTGSGRPSLYISPPHGTSRNPGTIGSRKQSRRSGIPYPKRPRGYRFHQRIALAEVEGLRNRPGGPRTPGQIPQPLRALHHSPGTARPAGILP